jgi:serine/threonine-protein kinase
MSRLREEQKSESLPAVQPVGTLDFTEIDGWGGDVKAMLLIAAAASMVGLTSACATTVTGTPKAEKSQAGSQPASTPAPTPAVGSIAEQDLEGLLLPVEDIQPVMDAPDLAVDKTYAEMPPSTVGYIPEDCASAAYNTVETGYRDSGFTATRGVVMQEPASAPQLLHVVDEGVVAFPDATAAAAYVTKTVGEWGHCAKSPFTAQRPESVEHWNFGDVTENNGVTAIPKMTEGSGWTCSHAITSKANVVVDVSACGFSVAGQASDIVSRIRDKIPG